MKIVLPAGSPMHSSDFLFGVATSSFQIEGAADQRLPSIWDTFCDKPGAILDGSNARNACDHLARWEEDVELMVSMGLDAYRFSISWPRVLKEDGSLNQEGIGFYQRLIDSLNQNNIKPFVTLYHWDLPQHLEDQGGWLSRDTAYRFQDYADVVSRTLGDGVYSYATLNEPYCSSYLSYELGIHAPGLKDPAKAKQAAHHLLLAHGLAMPVLKGNCPGALSGIVLNLSPCYPEKESEIDRLAANLADQYFNGWYTKPILQGAYPKLMEMLPEAVRPDISEGDLEVISHPLDYLGLNYYTRGIFRAGENTPFVQVVPEGVPLSDMGWEIFPQGLTDLLQTLDANYDLPPVFITESGIALKDQLEVGVVSDPDRTVYIQQHLAALDRAAQSGVDVRGYFTWSLMDNFEWAEGYSKRFGLAYVDYATQERVLKQSGHAYRDLLLNRKREAS